MKRDRVILILSGIILVLLLIVIYILVVKPVINNYVFEKQVEAQNILIEGIVMQINQMGYASLPFQNQTIILVPYFGNRSINDVIT